MRHRFTDDENCDDENSDDENSDDKNSEDEIRGNLLSRYFEHFIQLDI